MEDMVVSFIIPAYNAADTIVRCLESIYGLSLKRDEFEVIVIDDCSTDETVSIIEDWKSNNENLTLLRQTENHRQGAARNRGVSVAKGEYICFVDADDAVMEGIVKAIQMAKEKQTDMTALHFAFANEQGTVTSVAKKLSFAEGLIFSGVEMQNIQPYWCSAPWGFIYSKEFLARVNYSFAEDVLYEDGDFVMAHLYYAKRITYSKELGYFVYYREESTTRSTNYKNVADYLLLGMRMLNLYGLAKGKDEQFAQSVLEGACFNVALSCKRLIKMGNLKEAFAYYNRIDERVSRKDICNNKSLHLYYWNGWTSLCMKHKRITIMALAVLIPTYKLLKRK